MAASGSEVFVEQLKRAGEIKIIKEFCNPRLEITELADRISKREGGGEALLFKNTGTDFPVLINALGSEKRIQIAFKDRSPASISKEILEVFKTMAGPPGGMMGQFAKLTSLRRLASWMPKKKNSRGLCQEVVMETPDLNKLPILTCWPADGGPFITLPLVHTIDPQSGIRNVGMYRMQVFNQNTTGMHWHMHKTGARHYREYKKLGRVMPVAVALGGDPVYTYSATAPLPDGIDEYILAGFLRRKPVELVKCLTQDIWVPSDADFILEGYVDPQEAQTVEGPFGDHTGFYSLADQYPVFHITAITHRKSAVYPATIVGIPPQEDAWIAKATEEIFMEPIKLSMIPELIGFHLPEAGVAHNIGLFSIQSEYPGQGRKTLNTVWGAGQMMFTKFGLVFKDLESLSDYTELARLVSERVNPLHDLVRSTGPVDILDHASEEFAIGGKLGLDVTGDAKPKNIPSLSEFELAIQTLRSSNPAIFSINSELLEKGISLVHIGITKSEPKLISFLSSEISHSEILSRIKFWIFTDVPLADPSWYEIAWLTGSHVDPNRDCLVLKSITNPQKGILCIDATRKSRRMDQFQRDWPNPVVMSEEIIEAVDLRWKGLGIGPFEESPSKRYAKMMKGKGAVAEE